METRAHHVIIGLFTVLGVAAILLFVLWLGRPTAERDYDYYIVAFTRAVSGLSVGSRVEYSGIRVGEVVELSLNPEDPRRVRALIRVLEMTPVNVDTQADLALANISGAMKIQLHGGTPESSRIDGDINDPPVIVAEPSSIGAVLDSGEELVGTLAVLLERANKLLSPQNIERVSQTLEHLEQSTRVISEERETIAQAIDQFARLSVEANTAVEDITRLARNTDTALNDEERGLLSGAGESIAALERATERVDALLAKNEGALNSGMQGLNELGPALEDLRSTLGNLNRITRRLEEDPSGFLFRGEEMREFEP